jgi:hypothetical protein
MFHMHDSDVGAVVLDHPKRRALQRAVARIHGLRKSGDKIGATTWALITDTMMELTRDRHDESLI